MISALLILLAFNDTLAFADLAAVKAEPDLNRRSELALMNADEKIDAGASGVSGRERSCPSGGHPGGGGISDAFLRLAGTNAGAPRKSRYYKRAELKVSALMRRLSGFRDEVSFDFRPKRRRGA